MDSKAVVPLLEPVGTGPVSLALLAHHMQTGRWLDIRCDNELIQRVRIIEIVVRVQGEDIVVRQEWLDEQAERDEDYYRKHTFVIDSDAIWRVRPSELHPSDVRPYGIDVPREPQDEGLQQRILVTVLNTARGIWKLGMEELSAVTEWKWIPHRYACMVVLYEVSDLDERQITQAFGYKSVQPFVSARDMVRRPYSDECRSRQQMARQLGRHVDECFPPPPPRTSRTFPTDYKPLLKR